MFLVPYHGNSCTRPCETKKVTILSGFLKILSQIGPIFAKNRSRTLNRHFRELASVHLKFYKCYEADFWYVDSSNGLEKNTEVNLEILILCKAFLIIFLHFIHYFFRTISAFKQYQIHLGWYLAVFKIFDRTYGSVEDLWICLYNILSTLIFTNLSSGISKTFILGNHEKFTLHWWLFPTMLARPVFWVSFFRDRSFTPWGGSGVSTCKKVEIWLKMVKKGQF